MKLIFVYNAEAGLLNGMMDSIHKIVSPDTYECSLCAITHGSFTMDKTWREYLRGLPYETTFHHRKDFRAAYPDASVTLPAILAVDEKGVRTLVSADQLKAQKTVNDLIGVMDTALAVKQG